MIHADEGPNLDWQGRLGFDLRPRAQVLPDDACDSKGKMGDTRSCGIGAEVADARQRQRQASQDRLEVLHASSWTWGATPTTRIHSSGGLKRSLTHRADGRSPGGGRLREVREEA